MRKSKTLTFVLMLIMLVCVVAVCICACNTTNDNSGNNQGGGNEIQTPLPEQPTPETPTHTHILSLVSAKSADCVNSGNSAYYTCDCGKWFTDSNATTEITDKSSVVIGALGHKYSTEWSQSKTQHWHECSVCGGKKDTANHIDTDATCICGYKKPVETVKITAIYLDKSTLSIYIGNSVTLNATLIPTNATEEITWVSTNTAIATVNNGVITGVSVGTTTIIASSPSGIVANCSVFVSEDTHGFTFSEYGNGYAVTAYTGTDTIVTVPDSYNNKPVIAIGTGYNGFGSCTNILEVVLPDSIYQINARAFNNCSNLKKINIPNNVTTIGDSAFKGCSKLASIEIPNGVTKIESRAFQECSGLKILILSDSVVSFGYYAFDGCVNIENLTAPSYIFNQIPTGNLKTIRITSGTTIENAALKNCSQLQEIILCDTITEIGDEVFSGCSSLTSITIPNSVTSVGGGLFYNCSCLETVTLSNKLESLPYYQINYSEVFGFFEGCINLKNVEIPNGVKTIDDYAFMNCSGLTDVTVPESVNEIAEGAFYGCNSLESITLPFVGGYNSTKLEQGIEYVFGYIFGYDYTSSTDPIEGATFQLAEKQGSSIKNYYCFIPASLQKVSIIGSSKYINYSAFNNCKNLKELTISDSITSIGESAFKNCSGLKSVIIGNSVSSIGSSAFYGCSGLTSVTIPNSVTVIGSMAFFNCNNLSSITIPFVGANKNSTSNLHFGYIFGAPSYDRNSAYVPESLETVIISGGTKICEFAFYECGGLKNITIPDSVIDIEGEAFSGCSSLTSITIPSSVTSLNVFAFRGCRELTAITVDNNNLTYFSAGNCIFETGSTTLFLGCKNSIIPDWVTSIGRNAFNGCSGLTSIAIPDSVTSIGSSAFSGCSGLTSITIPDSVTSIGMYAFSMCTGLTSITIPGSVTSMGSSIFNGCSNLSNITISEGVPYIEERVFYGCSGLTSIVIPESVKSVGAYAFYGCDKLETFYMSSFDGTYGTGLYHRVTTSGNKAFFSAKFYYYSETEPTDDMEYWHYDTDSVTPIVWGKDN